MRSASRDHIIQQDVSGMMWEELEGEEECVSEKRKSVSVLLFLRTA